jgi:hypothetical protein
MTLAAVAAVCLIAAPAFAQPGAPPAAQAGPAVSGAPAPASARALELSRRLIAALHLDETFRAMMDAMAPQMVDEEIKRIPGFRPEWRQPMIEAAREASADLMQELIKRAEPIYARTFSEDELAQAVGFYESPAGQSMIRKVPSITPQLMKDFPTLTRSMSADMLVRFCSKIGGCDKAARPPAGPTSS